MRGYERDEYEDWDEYEDDEGQEEDEGGEDELEETHQPTQEELNYLALRQRLKDSIRKQMKDLGTANSGSLDKTNALRNDNYGSFFGPSHSVISQRVIQESKSLLENPDLAARIAKPTQRRDQTSVSAPTRLKSHAHHRPTVTNGLKRKVEMIKNTRDYSFLLSEDAEVPAPKCQPTRNVSASKSDARSVELLPRSKPVVNGRGREHSTGSDGRKPILSSSNSKPKVGLEKPSQNGKSSIESRKQLGSNNGSGPGRPLGPRGMHGSGPGRPLDPKGVHGNGSGRPLGPKGMPSKSSVPATGKMAQEIGKSTMSGDRRPTSSSVQSVARRPAPSNLQSGSHRRTPSHVQQMHLKRPSAQKEHRESSRPKVIPKQTLPSSRVQLKQPPSKAPARAPLQDERPKAKPKRKRYDEGSDGEDAINMIRQMFGYHPNRFGDDDDDRNMEANFDDIQREEKRSAKIARKEDEEQWLLIQKEEEREKKRKLSRR